jgi:hypothetical protein
MTSNLNKYKKAIIILLIPLMLFVIDMVVWRVGVNSNKNSIEAMSSKLAATRNATSQGVYDTCRVNESKGFKTTSCSVMQDIVIRPSVDIASELESVFAELENQSWDTNFEAFKTELLEGKSRFDTQEIRFYHDDYDPNGDHDFIEVYRVDNGITLQDTGAKSAEYSGNESNLVVVRFHRDQLSSVSHYIVGQFIRF